MASTKEWYSHHIHSLKAIVVVSRARLISPNCILIGSSGRAEEPIDGANGERNHVVKSANIRNNQGRYGALPKGPRCQVSKGICCGSLQVLPVSSEGFLKAPKSVGRSLSSEQDRRASSFLIDRICEV